MPERGSELQITERALARPESRPYRYGEFAPSACSSGIQPRMPLAARIAVSPSGIPTCTCTPQCGVWRIERAQAALDQLVALAAAQAHVAVRAQRMDAGAEQRRDLAQFGAQRAEHADRLAGVVAHRGAQLQHAVGDLAGHVLGREPARSSRSSVPPHGSSVSGSTAISSSSTPRLKRLDPLNVMTRWQEKYSASARGRSTRQVSSF